LARLVYACSIWPQQLKDITSPAIDAKVDAAKKQAPGGACLLIPLESH
jgi:hypothetical protein